uniref:Uncharacterized protein n=1 Tax=Anguilla anguilla TaxID=7936 RepID=A0A0E9SWF7_ANGAN
MMLHCGIVSITMKIEQWEWNYGERHDLCHYRFHPLDEITQRIGSYCVYTFTLSTSR